MYYLNQLAEDFAKLAKDDSEDAFQQLVHALEVRDSGTFEKHVIPYLACRALIYKGAKGIEALANLLPIAPGHIYPMAILSSLWRASEGEFATSSFGIEKNIEIFNQPIEPSVRRLAKEKFANFLDECRTDPESFDRLIKLLQERQWNTMSDEAANRKFHEAVFNVLSDATLRISDRLIEHFEEILQAPEREEEYQQFFTKNPVFINPLASRLISKHKLGDDFITDYVLETLTGEYIAVEIEKPSDPIFTKANDFSSQFTHAFGQVIDFIGWLEQNIAYAQKKLPGIASPQGLLVIGRSSLLSPPQIEKLRRFNKNSSSVEILTFDDLLTRAQSLQKNIRHRARFLN